MEKGRRNNQENGFSKVEIFKQLLRNKMNKANIDSSGIKERGESWDLSQQGGNL